jgi:hypothetical protein
VAIHQQLGSGPVLGIVCQHAAQQVAQEWRYNSASSQRGVTAQVQLAADHVGVVEAGQRNLPARQYDQQHPQSIDVIGHRPVTTSGWMGDGTKG